MNRFFTVLLLVCALTSGCGEMQSRRVSLLDESVVAYGQALRWGRYSDADLFQMDHDGTHHRIDEDKLKKIRITNYRVENKVMNPDATSAKVSGEIEYFNTDYATVETVPFKQTWWYNDKLKHWFVEGPLPAFK